MAEMKIWGATTPVLIDACLHMHRITFEEGGVCSEHFHAYRNNMFYVLSGKLLVRTWQGLHVTATTLGAHESLVVPPRVRHQFEGLKSGVALEVYWRDGGPIVSAYDIERLTQGFMR